MILDIATGLGIALAVVWAIDFLTRPWKWE
jgi:hypothetical protein